MGAPQRFCTKCGHELRPGTRFCTTCGHTAALSAEPADQAGTDNANRDFTATTTRPAPPRRDASRRPWPQAEPRHRLPDESGAAFASPEAGGYEPLPQPDDQIPNQFRPDQSRPYRFRPLLVGSLVVLAAAAVAAAAILIFHPSGHHARSPAVSLKSPALAVTPSSPSPAPTSGSLSSQQQAADSLAALLNQSVGDRNSVNGAFQDVMQCGPNLDQDAQVFRSSATSRQRLLQQLAGMPSRAELPGQMLQALTGAWQASVEADNDFAAWAQDQASSGCVPNQPDPYFQAAAGPDLRATADKKAFLQLWNPLAVQYSLATYQQNEL
jgi:hypothetical protein